MIVLIISVATVVRLVIIMVVIMVSITVGYRGVSSRRASKRPTPVVLDYNTRISLAVSAVVVVIIVVITNIMIVVIIVVIVGVVLKVP